MTDDFYVAPIMKKQLDNIKRVVTKKDRDFVMVIDGEEGSGKSVLAQQLAKQLDPKFNINNITFTADQFIERLRNAPKFSAIILDEAFVSANSRNSLSQVNKALIGVATEMRQQNLFVIIVLPSFFDLDRYFAIWRCRTLLHVYFNKTGDRGSYVIFPKSKKKYLYLKGKKFYNYSTPKSPYPVCYYSNHYIVDEKEYRLKKRNAFKERPKTGQYEQRQIEQRDRMIIYLNEEHKLSTYKISDICGLSRPQVQEVITKHREKKAGEAVETPPLKAVAV